MASLRNDLYDLSLARWGRRLCPCVGDYRQLKIVRDEGGGGRERERESGSKRERGRCGGGGGGGGGADSRPSAAAATQIRPGPSPPHLPTPSAARSLASSSGTDRRKPTRFRMSWDGVFNCCWVWNATFSSTKLGAEFSWIFFVGPTGSISSTDRRPIHKVLGKELCEDVFKRMLHLAPF